MANPLIALLGVAAILSMQGYGHLSDPGTPAPKAKSKKARPPVYVLLPAVPGRGIRDVPNIAIKYYDVTGKNFAEVVRAIEAQRKNPATGQVSPGGAGYGLGANVNKETVKDKCTVVDAQIKFTPSAELPRLANEAALAPADLAQWRAYLSQIEVPAAASLWFIADRTDAVQKSMIGKECDLGVKTGNDGLAKLRADHAAFQQQYAASLAAQAAVAQPKKK